MKIRYISKRSIPGLIVLLFLSFFIAACAFVQLREETEFAKRSIVLVGNVSSALHDIPVLVAAYSINDSERNIIHYTILHEPGSYELLVPVGDHNIVAFGDLNKNLVYDKGEPAGQILSAEQVSIPAGGVAGDLDIVLTEQDGNTIDFPIGSKIPAKEHTRFHSSCPGAIANLDEYIFSEEYGQKGFWAPLEFFREISGNIYFIEEYDPEKIPVLFVHGAAGSPQNWKIFIESIDRSKYQPWIFYYPSGASIDSMSYLLFWKLLNLQKKYKIKEMYITAHSMGGLVTRSFLVNYGQYFPNITCFISISTPWGGEELAELGVKYAPAVIPAWIDMQPGSDFLNSIYQREMPAGVEHYLLFGHKGNRNILRPNNDKVVTLESQLDQRSQKDAVMIYGFNEDHISILSSDQVLAQYNAILSDRYQNKTNPVKNSGNRLTVDFSFDYPDELPRPGATLLLHPVDKEGNDTMLYLGAEESGQKQGPFPAGNYEVSLLAPAFIPEPLRVPVHIDGDSNPRITFSMKPVGYIRGFVAEEETNIQVGKERRPDPEVPIQSITLKGNGIIRELIPLKEDTSYDDLLPEYYLKSKDFSTGGAFFIFELPAGKYELQIIAEDYEPYSEILEVKPGQYKNTTVVDLLPEKAY